MSKRPRRATIPPGFAILAVSLWLVAAAPTTAQVGALVSPGSAVEGPLAARGHRQLPEVPRTRSPDCAAAKCLACHKPIAERIAARRGVHRDVTGTCEGCHAEHAGADAEPQAARSAALQPRRRNGLRPRRPPRAARAGLRAVPQDAVVPEHASRVRLVPPGRSQGRAGTDVRDLPHDGHAVCRRAQQFDHSKARFALTGAHRTVDCAKCHVNKVFTGLKFGSCADCHREPHRQAFGADCTSCHTTDTWKTRKVDHARTAFPLKGAHAAAPCTACHLKPAVQVRLQAKACSDCHADVHRGQFKQDLRQPATPPTFRKAPFDHAAATQFPLTGQARRARLLPVPQGRGDRRTASDDRRRRDGHRDVLGHCRPSCASCHEDVHRGAHGQTLRQLPHDRRFPRPETLRARAPRWRRSSPAATPRPPAGRATAERRARRAPRRRRRWRRGRSRGSARPAPGATPTRTTANWVTRASAATRSTKSGFAAGKFSHATSEFPLTGRHQAVRCSAVPRAAVKRAAGQPAAAGAQPSPARDETGRVLLFKAKGTDCASCHKDVHLGQLGTTVRGVPLDRGVHASRHTRTSRSARQFLHRRGTPRSPAARATSRRPGRFPSGQGTAVRFAGPGHRVRVVSRPKDAHRGALGNAVRTLPHAGAWPSVSRAFHKVGAVPARGPPPDGRRARAAT